MPFNAAPLSVVVRRKNHLLEQLAATDLANWQRLVRQFGDDVLRMAHPHPLAVQTICADVIEQVSAMLLLSAHDRDHLYVALASCGHSESSAALFTALADSLEEIAVVSCPRINLAVNAVVQHISLNYHQPLTADVLAKLVGLRRTGLSVAFHSRMACTIHQYLTRVRIAHAKHLISRGEKIDAVALLVGYRSKKNFYRQFASDTGCSPKAWRADCLRARRSAAERDEEKAMT
jgi:AraC-like DNA-binding protein